MSAGYRLVHADDRMYAGRFDGSEAAEVLVFDATPV
jgi:hypothetical protein